MSLTIVGAQKIAAKKSGLSLDEYLSRINQGLKRCYKCKEWKARSEFNISNSRGDGLCVWCKYCMHKQFLKKYKHKRLVYSPRDGDKVQARRWINIQVKKGLRPHPNTLPCADCGHIWKPGDQRHQYDHYLGYSSNHHYDVEVVCSSCNFKRELKRGEIFRDSKGRLSGKLEVIG